MAWTGFRGKTLWDWMQLLFIPVLLAVGAASINWIAILNEERRAEVERETEIARARDTALQSYLDEMTKLLLDRELRISQPGEEVREVARVRTLAVMRQLDATRNGIVLRFLSESGLVETVNSPDAVLSLSNANLHGIDLSTLDLSGLDLSKANLNMANLSFVSLSGADLSNARLSKSNLIGANLLGANLRGAELMDALVTDEQLAGVSELVGATMPDGTKMTEERWQEFRK